MKKIEIKKILNIFEIGTELNLGIFPNKNMVKYGFSCTDNELTLYLQASNENLNTVKNYAVENGEINFYKWSIVGNMVSGDGIVKILETKEKKIEGLKYIMEQQVKMNKKYNFTESEVQDIFVFKIIVKNVYKMN